MAAVLKTREERTSTKAVSPRALGFTTKAAMKNVEVRRYHQFCLVFSTLFPLSHSSSLLTVAATVCATALLLSAFVTSACAPSLQRGICCLLDCLSLVLFGFVFCEMV